MADSTSARSYHDLRKATDAVSLLSSHEETVRFWRPANDLSERLFAAVVDGKIWTPDEEAQAKFRRKSLMHYNLFRVSARIVEGWFRDMRMDVSFTPVRDEVDDKELVEGLEGLRIQEAQVNDDATKDSRTFMEAWVGPNAWQELWVESAPGLPAVTRCANRDRFSVYPDPRSRIPITRDDAEYIDVVDWMRPDELVAALPQKKDRLEALLASRQDNYISRGTGSNEFQQRDISRDRDHENRDYRDGRYKVVTRYYRVLSQNGEYWDTDNQMWTPFATMDEVPDSAHYRMSHRDELWWIVAVPGLSKYEHFANERFYLQLRHPRTGKVMFPFIEMAAEITNGQVTGFAQHELEPVRGYNAMVSNVLHSAKHSASQAKLIDESAFEDENEAKQAAQHHSDADRSFKVKKGRLGDAMKPIDHSNVSNDTYRGMDIAKTAYDEISSTPPALQGMNESQESGILYSQRVSQGQTQLKPMMANYIAFLERKYLMRYMMWREYYTTPQLVRLMDPTPEQRDEEKESVTLNQQVPEGYKLNPETGAYELVYRLKNDVNAILYDVTVRLSKRTPSERLKVLAQLSELAQSPMAAQDPGIGALLFVASADLMDMPQKYQDQIREYSVILKQKKAEEDQANSQAAQQNAEQVAAQTQATTQKMMADAQQAGLDVAKTQTEIAKEQSEMQLDQMEGTVDAKLKSLDAKLKELEIMEKELELKNASLQVAGSVQNAASAELTRDME
jgi:hypothetical protein